MSEAEEDLRQRLISQTARIHWSELQRFHAGGNVLHVADGVDLVAVAMAMAEDDSATVSGLMERGEFGPLADELAMQWVEADQELWAVVVAPWVLVQVDKNA